MKICAVRVTLLWQYVVLGYSVFIRRYAALMRKRSSWTGKFAMGCAIAVVLIPMAVHILFKLEAPTAGLSAEWSAGELLDYIGGFLGAAATIIAVRLTIIEDRRGRVEEQRLSAIPLVAMTAVESTIPNSKSPSPESTDTSQHVSGASVGSIRHQNHECEYVIIDKCGETTYETELPERYRPLVEGDNLVACEMGIKGVYSFTKNMSQYLCLRLLSAGNGPAINVAVWMEHDGHAPMFENQPLQLPARQLTTGSSRYVGVLFENVHAKCVVGRHELVIRYSDVMGNLYEQRHPINVEKNVRQGEGTTQLSFDFKIDRRLLSA